MGTTKYLPKMKKLETIRIYIQDMGIELDIENVPCWSGKVRKTEGIELLSQEKH